MNTVKKTTLTVGFVISILGIILGTTLFYSSRRVTKGIFFRKNYGYLSGFVSDQISLNFTIFNFENQNMDLFEDIHHLKLGSENLVITDIKLESINKNKHIEVFNYVLNVKLIAPEIIGVTNLIYERDEITSVNVLGHIYIEILEGKSEDVSHGANSSFINGYNYYISISSSNKESYTFTELLFYNEKIISVKNYFPLKYSAGEILEIELEIIYDINEFDVFVLKPILVYQKENIDGYFYMSVAIQTRNEVSMNYKDIVEYCLT